MFNEHERAIITTAKNKLLQVYNARMSILRSPALTSMFKDNCIISGGAIAAIMLDRKYSDIDIYAKERKMIKPIRDYITTELSHEIKLTSASYDFGTVTEERPLITGNAVTLKQDVQFISLISEEDGARSLFDFVHCMPWYDLHTNRLYISRKQYDSINAMKLELNLPIDKVKYRRVDKYIQKGWGIDPETKNAIQNNSVQ